MKIITESGMSFGEYDESKPFHIEESIIYKNLGSGLKVAEFILKYNKDSIIFLEAKSSCPNAASRFESDIKAEKFEDYYSSITEKFINSLQIYLAALLNRFSDSSEVGINLKSLSNMRNAHLKFILVIRNAKDFAWLVAPQVELNARLLQYRRIWGIDVIVLNEELAERYGLLC